MFTSIPACISIHPYYVYILLPCSALLTIKEEPALIKSPFSTTPPTLQPLTTTHNLTKMANQSYNTCPLPELLRYYIVRGNDMIPLISIDQLPHEYRPVGLPAKLGHRQMSEEGWKFVAETLEAPKTLSVAPPITTSLPHRIKPSSPRAPDPQPHAKPSPEPEKTRQHSDHSGGAPITESDTPGLNHSIHSSAAAPPLPVAHTANAVHQNSPQNGNYNVRIPSGITRRPAKKEYCTYWIQRGECAYVATGCKYKHEMPDLATLRTLGFNSYPQ